MDLKQTLGRRFRVNRQFWVQCLGFLVSLHGIYILVVTLMLQINIHHASRTYHLSELVFDLPLLIGLGLLYLGALLRRRKRTAWLSAVLAYTFYLGLNVSQLMNRTRIGESWKHELLRAFVLPIVILACLFLLQDEYVVKSDIRGFSLAVRFSAIVLLAAFIYGVTGLMLMDDSDYHREIGLTTAMHYTLDQFNITTTTPLKPYTRRAHFFDDSLTVVSVAAFAYAGLSLFQPLRFRLQNQEHERERLNELLYKYGAPSEEYFKLWPHDKQFIFDETGQSALAFHVSSGVALCLSDPVGSEERFPKLMRDFNNMCFGNDWLPALIHIEDEHKHLYERHGYSMQKLGQEAILNLEHFNNEVKDNKYFRQIRNKFDRKGFSYELLTPPHHDAIVERLKSISDEWLGHGNRAERGFVMGYFTPEYIQQCEVMAVRDAANTIQAFVNLIPAGFNEEEATYDMLRQTNKSLGNINDYLLMGLIEHLSSSGYKSLNLGLCPLAGLDDDSDEEKSRLISGVLAFAYANGDRFYSFSGLYRFKAKYEPEWRDRYVGYQNGLRGFARTMNAIVRAMRV